MEKGLMVFDIVLHASARTVNGLIEKRGPAALDACYHKAQVLS